MIVSVSSANAADAKVWVTGARGMLGRAVVELLHARDIACVQSGRELDICDEQALMAFAEQHRPTHLINCAAMTAVDLCESQGELANRVNGEGPAALGRVCAQWNVAAAHVSTDYVFDGSASTPWREEMPCGPKSSYGKSKWLGEQKFLAALPSRGFVVRTSWLFGPGGKNFVSTMLQLMRDKEQLHVVDDQRGRPTATPDLARALVDLLGLAGQTSVQPNPRQAGIYHFANAGEVSWFDFAREIHRVADTLGAALTCRDVSPTTSDSYRRAAPRPAYSVLSTDKIASALGYAPRPYTAPLSEYIAQHLQSL